MTKTVFTSGSIAIKQFIFQDKQINEVYNILQGIEWNLQRDDVSFYPIWLKVHEARELLEKKYFPDVVESDIQQSGRVNG